MEKGYRKHRVADIICFFLLIVVLAGLPAGIIAYDRHTWKSRTPDNSVVFHLTGHTEKGWVLGSIAASDVLTDTLSKKSFTPPVLEVKKGDRVVLKLTSSDVVHGFSLKDFGIFINDGIHPGSVEIVSFVADKEGRFSFACNAICGDYHKNMVGTILVKG